MNIDSQPNEAHSILLSIKEDHRLISSLSYRIRMGFRNETDLKRIKKYADWYFENYIRPHFILEEERLLSLLPADSKVRKRAMADRRRVERLFEDNEDLNRSLSLLEEELDELIRFEERVLYEELHEYVSEKDLEILEALHHPKKEGFWPDPFWEEKNK